MVQYTSLYNEIILITWLYIYPLLEPILSLVKAPPVVVGTPTWQAVMCCLKQSGGNTSFYSHFIIIIYSNQF